jgi:hypothetical protein
LNGFSEYCDVDNVIFNFSKGFQQYMKEKYDIQIDSNPDFYSFTEFKESKQDLEFLQNSILEYVNTNPCLSLVDVELPKLFHRLRQQKFKIVLLTAFSGDKSIRIQNLKRAGIEYDDIIFDGNKLPIIQKLKPDLVIEDKPKTIIQLEKIKQLTFIPTCWKYTQKLCSSNKFKYIKPYKNTEELTQLIEDNL